MYASVQANRHAREHVLRVLQLLVELSGTDIKEKVKDIDPTQRRELLLSSQEVNPLGLRQGTQ